MLGYAAALEAYFRRPARPMKRDICGRAGSARQGVIVELAAGIKDQTLHTVGFRAFACPHIIATCNWLADRLEGAPVAALHGVDLSEAVEKFEIPVEKAGKLLIIKDAAAACYEQYRRAG